jgi:peptide/nickel transport system substrate-binding protein
MLDDQTTALTGLPGFIDDHYFLSFWTPLPRHAWEKYSPTELLDQEEVTRTPLGYGPYVIEKWISGDRIETRRNDQYFRAGEGLPYFERVIFRFIPASDGQALLLSGQCDLLPLDTVVEDQLTQWHEADQAGRARLYAIAGPAWEHLTFGINPAFDYDRPDFFEDVRMRQAIAYCIDRQKLVDEVLGGHSLVAESYLPPDHVLYADEAVRRYPFDPAQGQAMLGEMGWRDEDGDGVREAHAVANIIDGTALRFDFATRTNSLRELTLPYIAADLLACGIDTELRLLDSEFFANTPEGLLYGRRFDLAQFAWLTGERPPCELYLSARIPTSENEWQGENVSGYQNPDYDAACEQALNALPGTEAYLTAHHEAQRLFSEDLPALPLFMRLRFAVSRPDLTGLILDPIEDAETWNIEEFALKPGN